MERTRRRREAFFRSRHLIKYTLQISNAQLDEDDVRSVEERWAARWLALERSPKDSCDSAPRVPRLRTAPTNSPTSQLFTEVHRTQKQFRNYLVTTWTTMTPQCVVTLARNQSLTSHQSQSFKRRGPVLPTVSCGSVGWCHARWAKVSYLSTPWLDLNGSLLGPWFCPRPTSVLDFFFLRSWILERTQ